MILEACISSINRGIILRKKDKKEQGKTEEEKDGEKNSGVGNGNGNGDVTAIWVCH